MCSYCQVSLLGPARPRMVLSHSLAQRTDIRQDPFQFSYSIPQLFLRLVRVPGLPRSYTFVDGSHVLRGEPSEGLAYPKQDVITVPVETRQDAFNWDAGRRPDGPWLMDYHRQFHILPAGSRVL